jgi:cytochrome bd-type quinol oxidase subunit 1
MSSGLQAPILVGVIVGIVALYTVAIGGFIVFTTKIVKKGPDFNSPIPWAPKQN